MLALQIYEAKKASIFFSINIVLLLKRLRSNHPSRRNKISVKKYGKKKTTLLKRIRLWEKKLRYGKNNYVRYKKEW